MVIDKLYIDGFRNLAEGEISFSPGVNILVGKNAQGKTNIIEALYLLGRGRSFRRAKPIELIKWGSHSAGLRTKGRIGEEELDIKFRVGLEGAAKIEGNKRHFGKFPMVILVEDDIEIVRGGDIHRRRFLDQVATFADGKHWHNLHEYYKVLKQRNVLLKNISSNGGKGLEE
ncbi:MAG: AAA family ATPase, partial [bacterium]